MTCRHGSPDDRCRICLLEKEVESLKAITELAVKGLKEQLQISKFSCSVVNAITIENILSEIERLSHEQNS